MHFYNHYDLDAISDNPTHQVPEESYQPIYPCEIESVTNDHFTVIALDTIESPKLFIKAFEALCGVRYAKHRKNRIDVFLHHPTQFPTDFIQEFHRTYDLTQQCVEMNSKCKLYPVLGPYPKQRQEVLKHAKEVLKGINLKATDKDLHRYYRKIYRLHGPEMHPYFAGLLIVDMLRLNRDVQPVDPLSRNALSYT